MTMNVKKRRGILEPYNAEKINEMVEYVAEGLEGVSASSIALKAQIQLYDGITTEQIQQALIDACNELTTVETPNYNIATGRLMMSDLRKKVYGQFDPVPFYEHIYDNIMLGKYDKEILEKYTKEEIEFFESKVVHERDMWLTQAAVSQWMQKYLIHDKITGTVFETPQYAIMLIGMCLFGVDGVTNRNEKVVKFYEAISTQKGNLPSPIMAGVRSPTRQFSSCCLIDAADDLDSINAAGNAIVKYASKRAGIGINGGRIRALGSPVRGGEISHTGCINFYKKWQGDLHSCSQGGLRTSAASLNYPWWHLEIENLLVLKNNKGTESNRVRHLDYVLQANRLFYKRFKEDKTIALFSPSDVGQLYDLFFTDQDAFEKMYEHLENDPKIRKKVIKASELMNLFGNERASTGRIYLANVDHINNNSAFDKKNSTIRMVNLCVEITLPTTPLFNINDGDETDAEIALCTLAAFNLGNLENEQDIEDTALILVEALDCLLDYQEYPVKAAEKNKKRRTIGVGVINYSYWLAKNKMRYSDGSGNNATHKLFEMLQYYLLKASNKLAMEKGACEWFHKTTYAQGVLPIDRYKKEVDTLHNEPLHMDWDTLRNDIMQYGLRNSTVSALMPAESSALVANATNGIEPQRGALSIKASKTGTTKNIVPEYNRLKDYYEFVWEMPSNIGYLSLVAIMQKFIDQSASANTNYDPYKYPDRKVPMQEIIRDIFFAYRHGVKTLYYHNTRDKRGVDSQSADEIAADELAQDEITEEQETGCAGGGCAI